MRPPLRSFLGLSLLGATLLAAAGCPATNNTPTGEVPFNPQATTGEVTVRHNQQFEDIPVPYGFRLRRDQLFSYQGQMFRYGTFVYDGMWRGEQTRNFYREQMPVHGWQFKTLRPIASRDGDMAVFERGNEVVEIIVRELPTRIRVEVTVRDVNHTDMLMLARANRDLAENPPFVSDADAIDSPSTATGYTSSTITTAPYRSNAMDTRPGVVLVDGPVATSATGGYVASSTTVGGQPVPARQTSTFAPPPEHTVVMPPPGIASLRPGQDPTAASLNVVNPAPGNLGIRVLP